MIEWRSLSTFFGVQNVQDLLLLTEQQETNSGARHTFHTLLYNFVTRRLADRVDAIQSG